MSDLNPATENRPRYRREAAHPPPGPGAEPRIVGGWPEIDAALFDDGRGAAPVFPLELLPLPWRGWVADTAAGAGAPSASKDRSRWLEAWQAGPVVLQGARRVSRHERCPMSVLISIRPDRLMASLGKDDPRKGNPRQDEDGLAARLLYGWPDPPAFRPIAERRAAHDDQALDLLRSIGRVARAPADPLVLTLDEGAAKVFNAFLASLHGLLPRAEGLEADWLGKGGGTVARLAGVLALLAWAGSGTGGAPKMVGGEVMEAAVRLWSDYLRPHARLVFDRAGPTDGDRQARRVVRWLKANRSTEVSREDVRRHALGRSLDAHRTDGVLERLCAAGALRSKLLVFSVQGGRPARRWEVNPALLAAAEAGDEK